MSKSIVGKLKIDSFADYIDGEDIVINEIPLEDLYEFKNHPFRVLDDEKMAETVESIKAYGVLMPGIVRTRAEGGYEIISGHRRKHACELAGLKTMPSDFDFGWTKVDDIHYVRNRDGCWFNLPNPEKLR